VALSSPERHDLIRTALLHDIGKRHAHLGPVGRVLATLFVECRLPVHGRFRMYRDHGGLGAVELAELGAEPLVVTFARNHHGSRPDDVSPGDWELLENVDHARVRRGSRSSGYSSVPVVRR
jgi:putative nucleotidyltransferase with HDIG domain